MEAGTVMPDKAVPGEGFDHSTLSGATAASWLEGLVKGGSLKPCRALVLSAAMTEEAVALAGLGFHITVVDPDAGRMKALEDAARSHGVKIHTIETDLFRTRAPLYGTVDLVVDRTLMPSMDPIRRAEWSFKAGRLLHKDGRLIGLFPIGRSQAGPPFAISSDELRHALDRHFIVELLEPAGDTTPGETRGWKGIFRRK